MAAKAAAPGALPEVITPDEFMTVLAAGNVALVDVRSEREFAAGSIPGAINIPDGEFYNNLDETIKKLPTDQGVIIICATGARSAGAFFAVTDEPDQYKNPHGFQYLSKGMIYDSAGKFTILP